MSKAKLLWLGSLLVPAIACSQAVNSESAIVMDCASGKVLWSRNADEQLYPASTTKIMTALLLLEHCQPDEIIAAPTDVNRVKESSMHLKPGEKVRAKDMLYALMLRSANDGCYAVAAHIAGSVPKFAQMMNDRAKEIGCTHTHFNNPNGLNDPLHFTTAHDLALIGREAMKYPAFRNIVHTEKTKINRGTNWKDLWMVNHNRILTKDSTCDGIKTGWTIPAGHCFVGSATREGWRVITVVMKSKSWEKDTEGLFEWAFSNYAKHEEIKQGEFCGSIKVDGGQLPEIPVVAETEAYTLYHKGSSPGPVTKSLDLPKSIEAPLMDHAQVGQVVLEDADGFRQTIPVTAETPVLSSSLSLPGSPKGKFFAAAGFLVGAIYVRGRSKKRLIRPAR